MEKKNNNNTSSSSSQSNSAVERALTILEFIALRKEPVGVGEVAEKLGLAKSTTHRILEGLKNKQFIEQINATEKYTIGIKAIEVGMSGLTNWNIVDITGPYIRQLAYDLNETSFLAVFDQGEIVYVYKAEGNKAVTTNAQLGTRKPIHCTALGKAFAAQLHIEEVDRILTEKGMEKYTDRTLTDKQKYLAELSLVREKGYAMDDEEVEEGLTCFAVPIFNYTGHAVAAISVAGPTERMITNKDNIVNSLKQLNNQLSTRLGFVPAMRKRL
ncbi:IclR family transcriptional regulator [Cytobacillus oceanisediminis]|uniref:IclR family transcriptional regulator n=1 Tax=Cytobacillus oceanisediminis TaxID=665099 RepID=UPI001CCD211A|nr:IclR family transcriptional regulator [Cytobacillus oceanisediminis]MBZ9537026.1 IclR family transcriptional regulator [Cytobacillus oceanisediminis]